MSTDFAYMPGREILRRVEVALRQMPVGKLGGIPREHVARALRDLERSMSSEEEEEWTPFERGYMADNSGDDAYVRAMAKSTGETEDNVRATLRSIAEDAYWRNNLYQVAVRDFPETEERPALIHLSIKRTDQRTIRDWRVLQRIKNEIVGPEHEAVEIFPAEERLVDSANQYHLWALASPTARFPFGFPDRLVINVDQNDGTAAVQRRLA